MCYKQASATESPVQVECSSLRVLPARFPSICFNSDKKLICNFTIPCEEEAPQWTVSGDIGLENHDYTWSGSDVGWNGGLDPTNPVTVIPLPSDRSDRRSQNMNVTPNLNGPYSDEGKMCLLKAALKALSRNGWELADPAQAFTGKNWTVVKRTPM